MLGTSVDKQQNNSLWKELSHACRKCRCSCCHLTQISGPNNSSCSGGTWQFAAAILTDRCYKDPPVSEVQKYWTRAAMPLTSCYNLTDHQKLARKTRGRNDIAYVSVHEESFLYLHQVWSNCPECHFVYIWWGGSGGKGLFSLRRCFQQFPAFSLLLCLNVSPWFALYIFTH